MKYATFITLKLKLISIMYLFNRLTNNKVTIPLSHKAKYAKGVALLLIIASPFENKSLVFVEKSLLFLNIFLLFNAVLRTLTTMKHFSTCPESSL